MTCPPCARRGGGVKWKANPGHMKLMAGDVQLRDWQGSCMLASEEDNKPYFFIKMKVFDFRHLLQIKDNKAGLIPWSTGS